MTTNLTNWIDEELKNNAKKYEEKPVLKLESGTTTTIVIDFDKRWDKYTHPEDDRTKVIIPCTVNGVPHVWWLNVKNPVYFTILLANKGKDQTEFIIETTGKQAKTKYNIIQKAK